MLERQVVVYFEFASSIVTLELFDESEKKEDIFYCLKVGCISGFETSKWLVLSPFNVEKSRISVEKNGKWQKL